MSQQRPPLIIHKSRAPLRDPTPHGPPLLQLRLELRPRLLLLRRDPMHIVIGINRRLPFMPFPTRDEVHRRDFQDIVASALGAGFGCHSALLRVAQVVGGFGI